MPKRALRARVETGDGLVDVSPWGGVKPFRNEIFEGSVFFGQRPKGSESCSYAKLFEGNRATWCFELQIMGRFTELPTGTLSFKLELAEPTKLGLVTRSLGRAVLRLIKYQAQRRNADLGYAFGDEGDGSKPHLRVPALRIDTICVSDEPPALPVFSPEDKGTFRHGGAERGWTSIERSAVTLDTRSWFTFCFATAYLDWASWEMSNIPGLGNIALETFWGKQPCWISMCDDGAGSPGSRNLFAMVVSAPVCDGADGVIKEDAQSEAELEPMTELALESGGEEEAEGDADTPDVATPDNLERQQTPYDLPPSSDEPDMFDDVPDERQPFMRQASKQTLQRLEEIRARLEMRSCDFEHDGASSLASSLCSAPSLPWYFISDAGTLWWCVHFEDRFNWRHHEQLQELCAAVGGPRLSAKGSAQDLEKSRRVACDALSKAFRLEGLLQEFLSQPVDLTQLLSGSGKGHRECCVGVIEAEGRIAEHIVRMDPYSLEWRRMSSLHSASLQVGLGSTTTTALQVGLGSTISFPVGLATAKKIVIADAPAVLVEAAQRDLILVFQNDASAQNWLDVFRGQVSSRAPQMTKPWKDTLRRWPSHRLVMNDCKLCLEPPRDPPVVLSAKLLRDLIAAQEGRNERLLEIIKYRSCSLKCVNLSTLSPRELWFFWVNVYHCVLVHAYIQYGQPSKFSSLMVFYSSCSYLVGGHVFSLCELEHIVLRAHSSKPRSYLKLFLRTWPRSDMDLEWRPCCMAPRCPASAFKCMADWRLNLVLSAGNLSSSHRIPAFDEEDEALLRRAVLATLQANSCVSSGRLVSLPHVLQRFREDAPFHESATNTRERWLRGLKALDVVAIDFEMLQRASNESGRKFSKELGRLGSEAREQAKNGLLGYVAYSWRMHERFELLC